MNFENINNIESEGKGENVIIHSVFTRHGEKFHDINNVETDLSPKGEELSREIGKNRPAVDAIKGYSSDTQRTKATARAMVEESPTENKLKQRIRDGLSMRYNPNNEFTKEAKRIRGEILGKDYDDLPEEQQKARLDEYSTVITDNYLALGDKRPDPDTYSPVETAATVAEILDNNIKMANRLKSNSEVDLINATHDFNVAAFLKEVLVRKIDDKKIVGFDSIKEIGGNIEFNGGFEVLIKTDSSGNKNLKIFFRNQEYDIDQGRLSQLVEIAKNLRKNEKK